MAEEEARETKEVHSDQATDLLERQPDGRWRVVKTTYRHGGPPGKVTWKAHPEPAKRRDGR